jgi:hypothetical protein
MHSEKQQINARLTVEGMRILDGIARKYGITRTAALEIVVRESGRRELTDKCRVMPEPSHA